MSKIKQAQTYLRLYSERLGIIAPRMITDKQALSKFLAYCKYIRSPVKRRTLGMAWHKFRVIWINLRKHKTAIQLRHTIAHELIHIILRIPHGKRFNELTMRLISNRFIVKK